MFCCVFRERQLDPVFIIIELGRRKPTRTETPGQCPAVSASPARAAVGESLHTVLPAQLPLGLLPEPIGTSLSIALGSDGGVVSEASWLPVARGCGCTPCCPPRVHSLPPLVVPTALPRLTRRNTAEGSG